MPRVPCQAADRSRLPGQLLNFLDYHVHYIGKAFSQPVWDRLTGHHKMQKVLTMEDALSTKPSKPSLEISLLMLDIIGFDESNLMIQYDFAIPDGVEPIVYAFGDDDNAPRFNEYYAPHLKSDSAELTAEIEALLIHLFKPA